MKRELLQAVWPTWLTVVGQVMQYFAMVSGTLFLPYVALQKCKQTTATTRAGATYNYLNQAAPASTAVTTTGIHQDILVGGSTAEAASAAPHQGGCSNIHPSENHQLKNVARGTGGSKGVFFRKHF